jgi:hypothetical protein
MRLNAMIDHVDIDAGRRLTRLPFGWVLHPIAIDVGSWSIGRIDVDPRVRRLVDADARAIDRALAEAAHDAPICLAERGDDIGGWDASAWKNATSPGHSLCDLTTVQREIAWPVYRAELGRLLRHR